jgi:hypothetical protein
VKSLARQVKHRRGHRFADTVPTRAVSPKPRPIAVIYDAAEGRTCTFDRSGAGNDPLQACSAGERCRITGTYRTLGVGDPKTYAIQTITNLSDLQ